MTSAPQTQDLGGGRGGAGIGQGERPVGGQILGRSGRRHRRRRQIELDRAVGEQPIVRLGEIPRRAAESAIWPPTVIDDPQPPPLRF